MTDSKPTTLFSRTPITNSNNNETQEENRRISHWLEKLHIQAENIRLDDIRREEQSRIEANKKFNKQLNRDTNERNIIQLGIDSHAKTAATKNEADRQTVNDLVRKSNRQIISISSSFPWNIFPNTVEIEESRITFKFSQFLFTQSHSVDIKDISNVFIESSIFFSTLQIVSRTYTKNDIKIGHLNKKKAVMVQSIIEGLRTFAEHNINTSNYEIEELISKIGEFHAKS